MKKNIGSKLMPDVFSYEVGDAGAPRSIWMQTIIGKCLSFKKALEK